MSKTNVIKFVTDDAYIHDHRPMAPSLKYAPEWWKKLPKNFSKIIIVEYNATFGPELEVTVPDQEDFDRSMYHYSNLCFGASLKAYIKLLDQMGYVFIGTSISKINAFFVRKNELSKISLKDLPDINDLKFHTQSNIRESRNKDGKLNFLNEQKKINEIINHKNILF